MGLTTFSKNEKPNGKDHRTPRQAILQGRLLTDYHAHPVKSELMQQSNVPTNYLPAVTPENFSVSSQPASASDAFVDRRAKDAAKPRGERRQFGSSHSGLSEEGRQLAIAIDQYKLEHHRRYITCDEMLMVIGTLGYSK
ncbi:hypothetical protein RMSM_06096 [Rhodopirellula maiorica SM1]|uniref:Uncharacterized protein n=2 Tax=Novipirellula TaxID=2795426 RepID=M5RC98_9BACT|nr:hypothetical protein RMSM_06096 [Rhodopirellula maiorica SM1]